MNKPVSLEALIEQVRELLTGSPELTSHIITVPLEYYCSLQVGQRIIRNFGFLTRIEHSNGTIRLAMSEHPVNHGTHLTDLEQHEVRRIIWFLPPCESCGGEGEKEKITCQTCNGFGATMTLEQFMQKGRDNGIL